MKVECKSAWLLHFRAAPPLCVSSWRSFAYQVWSCRRIASHTLPKSARQSPAKAPRAISDGNRDGNDGRQVDRCTEPKASTRARSYHASLGLQG